MKVFFCGRIIYQVVQNEEVDIYHNQCVAGCSGIWAG